jgi:hypothetical protein
MEGEIRRLVIEYGVKNVKEGIDRVCRTLYEELQGLYGTIREEPKTEVVAHVQAQEVAVQEEGQTEKREKRLRIVKKKEPAAEPVVEAAVEPVVDVKPNEKVVEVVTLKIKKKAAPVVAVNQSNEEDDTSTTTSNTSEKKEHPIKTPEQIKKERLDHRAAVDKKRAEIESQGIIPESLLTKGNLESWIGSGYSYQRIAKELTGCHETTISQIAKSYGLRSVVAGMIAGNYGRGKA